MLRMYIRDNRKQSIYRPGAIVPVWLVAETGEPLDDAVASVEAYLLADGPRAPGEGALLDRQPLRPHDRPVNPDAWLAELTLHREPLESLGYPNVGVGLQVWADALTPPQEVIKQLQLGRGVETHDWHRKVFRSQSIFGKSRVRGVELEVHPGPWRFGQDVGVVATLRKSPIEVGVRCRSWGNSARDADSQATGYTLLWESSQVVDADGLVTITLPHDQPPTHDGGTGILWSAFARKPGGRRATDVPITVEG